jgi:hypothetical protein
MIDTDVRPEWMPLAIVANAFNRVHGDLIDFREFMFMGIDEGVSMYKHYDTRKYLMVSPDGPVRYLGVCYEPITWTPESIREVVTL